MGQWVSGNDAALLGGGAELRTGGAVGVEGGNPRACCSGPRLLFAAASGALLLATQASTLCFAQSSTAPTRASARRPRCTPQRQRGPGRPRSRRASAVRAAQVATPRAGVFRLRGHQSGKYLRPLPDGTLFHDDSPDEDVHLFAFLPGTGEATGLVQVHNLATDHNLFMTMSGLLGCFQGCTQEFFWQVHDAGDGCFRLENYACGRLIYSNSDGRLGSFFGEEYDDQIFHCEDRLGHVVPMEAIHSCHGLQDTGFLWEGYKPEPTLYTDALHAAHYIFAGEMSQLVELREVLKLQAPLSWGAANDVGLCEMEQPHAWAIAQIPFLARLQAAGLIDSGSFYNQVYRGRDEGAEEFTGTGLRPSGAIKFAVRPVSEGRRVAFEKSWLRAWHGPSLHALEAIAREGLKGGTWPREDGSLPPIYLSPSFQYTFCLFSVPDLLVGLARFRLVVEVRVRPGAFVEHGDEYRFCATKLIEPHIPDECLEWELDRERAGDVQVVGLVLRQLQPRHPTLRHDTNTRNACKALLQL